MSAIRNKGGPLGRVANTPQGLPLRLTHKHKDPPGHLMIGQASNIQLRMHNPIRNADKPELCFCEFVYTSPLTLKQ